MSVRDAPLVAQRRAALIDALGGACVTCGARTKLELDHKDGRDWDPRRLSSWSRQRRYEAEAKLGLLQVLCQAHNAAKAPHDKFRYRLRGTAPLPDPDAVPTWVTEDTT